MSEPEMKIAEYGYNNYFTFSIYMTRDSTIYERSDYTSLMFLGDVSALYGALQIAIAVLLRYVLRIDLLLDNSILNSVFRKDKPFKYPGVFESKILRKIGQRRINKELDIEKFLRK